MATDAFKDKRVTFVMGAGATLPFVRIRDACLSTEYLTKQLCDQERWAAIYDAFRRAFPANRHPECNFVVSLDEILSVIDKLRTMNERNLPSHLQGRLSVPLPSTVTDVYGIGVVSFEQILYLLDRVCNCLDDIKSNMDNVLFDIWAGTDVLRQQLQQKRGWNYVPYLCREVLASAVLDMWASCDNKRGIEDNRSFLASVLEKFGCASIYSLNYDPLLYEAAREVTVKGFTRGGQVTHEVDRVFETGFSEENTFNPKLFYLSDNVMAFLHGHVGFVPDSTTDDMHLEAAYAEAQKKRISGVARGEVSHVRRGPKGLHYNVFLTSGLEKFESFYDSPYSFYLQRFTEDVIDSDYIVFIGSSLGDQHINLWATNAWRLANGYAEEPRNLLQLRKLSAEPKKIIIVTRATAKGDFADFLYASNIGRRLFDLLKESIAYPRHQTNNSLGLNGYADIGEGLFLYLNGTQRFLSEIWQIQGLFA